MRHATARTYFGGLTVKAKPTRELTRREQMATFSSNVYVEKTPEQKASLAIAYDTSVLLLKARIEARQNAQAWAQGKNLTFEAANRFASAQQ